MRELFQTVSKNSFFRRFWCFLRFERVNWSEKVQNTWEKALFSIFSSIFPPVSPIHFKITFLKSTRIELSLHKVLF